MQRGQTQTQNEINKNYAQIEGVDKEGKESRDASNREHANQSILNTPIGKPITAALSAASNSLVPI